MKKRKYTYYYEVASYIVNIASTNNNMGDYRTIRAESIKEAHAKLRNLKTTCNIILQERFGARKMSELNSY